MVKCVIDGQNMTTRAAAHQEIAKALALPTVYGSNLDALWDVASPYDADMTLVNPGALLNALQGYGCKLIATLYEAAESNPEFTYRIED